MLKYIYETTKRIVDKDYIVGLDIKYLYRFYLLIG